MTLLTTFSMRRVPAGARRRSLVAAGAVLALAGSGVVAANAVTPPPAHLDHTVGLTRVGPIDESNGFPLWYEDSNGVKLELCLDPGDPYCIMGDVPNPDQPVAFPDNFPDEAFWAAAESPIDAGGGETGILVTALEAAFASADGLPAPESQVSFGRVRIRVAGVIDGATYRVTHPFGTDTIVAEADAVKGLNVTEDIGSLTWDGVFDQTLAARTGPFLRWDPAVEPQAPQGYLGDVTVEHPVVGSPYDTNFFRVEGPVGSFTGSSQLCADPAKGDDPVATDDCIENYDFAVQGKKATRMGVQVTRANYQASGSGSTNYVDVWARSESGQRLVVAGDTVSDTIMADAGDGNYFARLAVDGPPPGDLAVTNQTDTPDTSDAVGAFGDKVHVTSATWDTDTHQLEVVASSGIDATLTLEGYPAGDVTVADGSNGAKVFTVEVAAPPTDVEVTSPTGSDTDDVVVKGSEFHTADVTAIITTTAEEDVAVGQPITFDSLESTGTISSYKWSVTPTTGGPLSSTTASSTTFTPSAPGSYQVTLQVTGSSKNNTDSDSYSFNVVGPSQPPTADAGEDIVGVLPTSTVTLDGSHSLYASSFAWTSAEGLTITNPDSPTPTVVIPTGPTVDTTYTFTLTVTGAAGETSGSTVTVTTDVDDLTIDQATFKRGGNEWRIRGGVQHCSANNTVRVYWGTGPGKVLLGTATPLADLGVCGYDFRLKNAPGGLRPGGNGQVTVESFLGGATTGAFTRL